MAVNVLYILSGNKEVTIKNVKYVPNLCSNLISVRKMTKNGKKVIFEVTTCRILNENYTLVTSATVYNALY